MEPQEQKIYCYCNKDCKKKDCLGIVAVILLVAFAFTIGLILGAVFGLIVLLSLPAIIVLAVILGLLFILTLIVKFCNKKRC